jgi:RNA polymerase sigma-70 factor (ECF subfamily)
VSRFQPGGALKERMDRATSLDGVCAALPRSNSESADMVQERLSLELVFRKYSRYVAAVAYRLLGRDDEVDDVVQEVFLQAVRGLQRLREPEAVKGWLATVTVRVAGRKLRMRKVRGLFGLEDRQEYEQVAGRETPADERALLARVYRLLDDELSVGERLAWTLRYVEGEQLDAVARICGVSLATAKRRIAAAQGKLEKALR